MCRGFEISVGVPTQAHAGGTGLADPPGSCFKLGNGPTTMLWGASASQSEAGRGGGGGLQALVAGPFLPAQNRSLNPILRGI